MAWPQAAGRWTWLILVAHTQLASIFHGDPRGGLLAVVFAAWGVILAFGYDRLPCDAHVGRVSGPGVFQGLRVGRWPAGLRWLGLGAGAAG